MNQEVTTQARAERRPNLALAFQELLTAVVRLRFNLQSAPNADVFRANSKERIRAAIQEASGRGYSNEDVKAASFAVVAFLDESVLTSKNPVFATWSRMPLQEELFGEHMAGETFFQYVQQLLSRRDSVETADVLEVYLLCILLGYRGRYGSSGLGELRAFADSIRDKVRRVRGTNLPLSPAWTIPEDPPLPRRRDPWVMRLVWVVALTAGLAIVTFAASEWMLASGVSAVQAAADQMK